MEGQALEFAPQFVDGQSTGAGFCFNLTTYGRFYRALFLNAHLNREGWHVTVLPCLTYFLCLQPRSFLPFDPTPTHHHRAGYLDDAFTAKPTVAEMEDDDPWMEAETYSYKAIFGETSSHARGEEARKDSSRVMAKSSSTSNVKRQTIVKMANQLPTALSLSSPPPGKRFPAIPGGYRGPTQASLHPFERKL